MSAWADQATVPLWAARKRLLDCIEDTAWRWAEGLPQPRAGDPATSVHIQVNQVEEIDAALLSRGETVPPPFWH